MSSLGDYNGDLLIVGGGACAGANSLKLEHDTPEWLAAIEALILVAEMNGESFDRPASTEPLLIHVVH